MPAKLDDSIWIKRIEDNGNFIVKHIIEDKSNKGSQRSAVVYCPICKNIVTKKISTLLLGSKCVYCHPCTRKSNKTIQDINDNIKQFNIVCLSDIYVNECTDMQFKCLQCNHVWATKYRNVIRGRKCPICSGTNSYGEQITGAILEVNNIDYLYQKSVNINGRRNVFDFWLVDKENNPYLAIELDGVQHRDENNPFYRGRQPDIDKNEYCHNHKIPMLRINYEDYSQQKIASILNKTLHLKLVIPPNNYMPLFNKRFDMVEYSKKHTLNATSKKYRITSVAIGIWFKKIVGINRQEWFRQKFGVDERGYMALKQSGILEQYTMDNRLVGQYINKSIASNITKISISHIQASINGLVGDNTGDYKWSYKKISNLSKFIDNHLNDGALILESYPENDYSKITPEIIEYYKNHSLESTLLKYRIGKRQLLYEFYIEFGYSKRQYLEEHQHDRTVKWNDYCKDAVEYYKTHNVKETLRLYNMDRTTLSDKFRKCIGVSHNTYKMLSQHGVIQKCNPEGIVIGEYYTLISAAESIGNKAMNSNIRKALRNNKSVVGGFKWRYKHIKDLDNWIIEQNNKGNILDPKRRIMKEEGYEPTERSSKQKILV